MTTITEDYVSFEIAKLLKAKGFDEKCSYVWMLDKANNPEDTDGVYKVASPCFMEGESYVSNEDIDRVLEYYDEYYHKDAFLCPTLQMAMKWLREEHSIIIIVEPHIFNTQEGRATQFSFSVWVEDNYEDPYFDDSEHQFESFSTYEKTCDVAIKYCLTNLV